ncbi:hypothetical protein KA005_58550 [bacterium]|nr:hypothetical protein [bacterium]
MTESEKRSEYLRKKRIVDFVIHVLYLLKKHEPWKDPSLAAKYKEKGIDLEKLASVDLTKIGRKEKNILV